MSRPFPVAPVGPVLPVEALQGQSLTATLSSRAVWRLQRALRNLSGKAVHFGFGHPFISFQPLKRTPEIL